MAELLRVEHLFAGYGEARVIQGLDFRLEDGQSLALLGRNGVGKTTLINSLIGVDDSLQRHDCARRRGHHGPAAALRARRGVGWTPQERNIFRSLTVEENLTAVEHAGPWTARGSTGFFPGLRSGGATWAGNCRAESSRCSRSAGRSSSIRACSCSTSRLRAWPRSSSTNCSAALRELARGGLSMIIVEQKPKKILPFTDEAIVLDRGAIAYAAPSADLIANPALLDAHLTATRKAGR